MFDVSSIFPTKQQTKRFFARFRPKRVYVNGDWARHIEIAELHIHVADDAVDPASVAKNVNSAFKALANYDIRVECPESRRTTNRDHP